MEIDKGGVLKVPDLLGHLFIGLILAELFNARKKSLIVLGALAPDLLSKLDLIYFYFDIPKVIQFSSFHTPMMMLLVSILIAPLFRYSGIKTIIGFNIGSMSHFLLDLVNRHFSRSGTRFLFPFSLHNYTLNLIWSDDTIFVLGAVILIYVVLIYLKKKRIINVFFYKKNIL